MPTPAEHAGRRLALLIATSDYSDPALRQLRSPGRDARELEEVLGNPQIGGFDVQVLMNATSSELHEGIVEFTSDRRPDDQLLIYLSCHGVLDDNGRLYYATVNTQRRLVTATAVAAVWLNERLEDCRSRWQILVLDCCHSGAFARSAKGASELALRQRFEPRGRGRVVLTASRSTEYSFEGDQLAGDGVPSVFTQTVVDGLRTGDADQNKDGLITVTDLYQYVYDKVHSAEPRQTPELWTYGGEGDLLVAYSIRGAVIEPVSLPEDLRVTLESPRPRIRETAVTELAELLDATPPGLALSARQALQRISDNDIPRVAAVARMALEASEGTAAREVSQELADRDQHERARQEAQQATKRQAEEQAHPDALRDEAATSSQHGEDLTSTPAPEPAPDRETRRVPGHLPADRATRRLVAIRTGAAIAIIGLLIAISSDSGTPHATSTAHVRWAHATADIVDSSPAVAGGTVYVGSDDDNVYALDAATGHVRWTYTTGDMVRLESCGGWRHCLRRQRRRQCVRPGRRDRPRPLDLHDRRHG